MVLCWNKRTSVYVRQNYVLIYKKYINYIILLVLLRRYLNSIWVNVTGYHKKERLLLFHYHVELDKLF